MEPHNPDMGIRLTRLCSSVYPLHWISPALVDNARTLGVHDSLKCIAKVPSKDSGKPIIVLCFLHLPRSCWSQRRSCSEAIFPAFSRYFCPAQLRSVCFAIPSVGVQFFCRKESNLSACSTITSEMFAVSPWSSQGLAVPSLLSL